MFGSLHFLFVLSFFGFWELLVNACLAIKIFQSLARPLNLSQDRLLGFNCQYQSSCDCKSLSELQHRLWMFRMLHIGFGAAGH